VFQDDIETPTTTEQSALHLVRSQKTTNRPTLMNINVSVTNMLDVKVQRPVEFSLPTTTVTETLSTRPPVSVAAEISIISHTEVPEITTPLTESTTTTSPIEKTTERQHLSEELLRKQLRIYFYLKFP
jgi:hypothetical protein